MTKRSRLRSQGVRRRRLLTVAVILGSVLAGLIWYDSNHSQDLLLRVLGLFNRNGGLSPVSLETTRGTIYDRNYKELAVSYERVSVYANIREIDNPGEVVEPLAAALGVSQEDLYERLGEGELRIWLAKDLSQEQEDNIRKLDLAGIYLHKEFVRYYPHKESGAHLVGFVERETGLSGMEHYLNQLETKYRLEEGKNGDLPQVNEGQPGVDGRHLVLTLDLKIQRLLDDYLNKVSANYPGLKVGALVLEAGSGALIGYSQIPSFDSNIFHTYPESSFVDIFNRVIAVPEPFKIFFRDVSLVASQDGQPSFLPWSIAAEKRKLGVQLQLWEKLGIDVPAAYDFTSEPPEQRGWSAFSSVNLFHRDFETLPITQTPLQILTGITRVLNGGVKIRPHAGDRFVLRRNQMEFLLEDLEPELQGNIVQDALVKEAAAMFGAQAFSGPLGSSFMTGSSTSYRQGDGVNEFERHFLTIGAVPAQNPELMLMIAASGPGFRTPQKEQLPVVQEAMKLTPPVVALQRVMKNLADMMSPRDTVDQNFRSSSSSVSPTEEVFPTARREIRMPQLIGMSLRKSLRLLQNTGVVIELKGSGRVVEQVPAHNTPLVEGTRVVLFLERGAEYDDESDNPSR